MKWINTRCLGHTEERHLIQTGESGNATRPERNLKECVGVSQAKDSAMSKGSVV